MHLSDLHIGIRLNDFSLIDDQRYIFEQILDIAKNEQIDTVLIAGDVYDKSAPSEESFALYDWLLTRFHELGINVAVISGNHDSSYRVSFASSMLSDSKIYVSNTYDGTVRSFSVNDEYGVVNVYLLPFVKPVNVRAFFPDDEINSYTDAIRTAISNIGVNYSERNIILSHQYVTGSVRCDSEQINVGGLDNVDGEVFDGFDYVALGHLHTHQRVNGKDSIRYCGTPLKYSVSEANNQKIVIIGELCEKGNLKLSYIDLKPLHELRVIKGEYDKLTDRSFYTSGEFSQEDYISFVLTDEEDVPDAAALLRSIYPRILSVKYDNTRTRSEVGVIASDSTKEKLPIEYFCELFEAQNGKPMTEEQISFSNELISKLWGEDV